jgi:formylglycine-generating enzyme required for sulfatase activity
MPQITELAARPRALLLLLALSRSYTRQSVADIFWEGEDLQHFDPAERKRINNKIDRMLTAVRAALGPLGSRLRSRQGLISLSLGVDEAGLDLETDYRIFKRAFGSSDPDLLRDALSLVRGSVAADLAVPSGVDGDWLERARKAQRLELAAVVRKLNGRSTDMQVEEEVTRLLDGLGTTNSLSGIGASQATPDASHEREELRRLARAIISVSGALPSDDLGEEKLVARARELLHNPDLMASGEPQIQRDRILLSHALDKMDIREPGAGVGPEPTIPGAWVRIPGGTFEFGVDPSDRTLRAETQTTAVVIANDFLISRFPVTEDQFGRFLKSCTAPEMAARQMSGAAPVTGVTWDEAQQYCEWINENAPDEEAILDIWIAAERRIERQRWVGTVSLPTEVEWERAARWPDGRLFPWGGQINPSWTLRQLHRHGSMPVGTFPDEDSPSGVADLFGNVWQWCADAWSPLSGEDPPSGPMRVVRGAGTTMDLRMLRTTCRFGDLSSSRRDDRGFRPVFRGRQLS